jgi:hypothetical protein
VYNDEGLLMDIKLKKVCVSCRTEKPIGEFWKSSRHRYGVQPNCKSCSVAIRCTHRRAYAAEHADELRNRKIAQLKMYDGQADLYAYRLTTREISLRIRELMKYGAELRSKRELDAMPPMTPEEIVAILRPDWKNDVPRVDVKVAAKGQPPAEVCQSEGRQTAAVEAHVEHRNPPMVNSSSALRRADHKPITFNTPLTLAEQVHRRLKGY